MKNEDEFLTASDAGRILNLSRDMVRILASQGKLESIRTANGYHLFRRSDVERLAKERAANPPRRGRKSKK